jgi:hypothetical protein
VLDVIYIALVIALFALVTLIAKGAERLVPPLRGSAPRDAMSAEKSR